MESTLNAEREGVRPFLRPQGHRCGNDVAAAAV